MTRFISTCFFLVFFLLLFMAGHASANDVRIGVLNIRGNEDVQKYWLQISDHLNATIPDHHFVIVLHTYKTMEQAAADRQLDFVVLNPAEYVDFQVKYDAARIATQLSHAGQAESAYIGSVIFTKANRTDITTLSDLRGKSLATVSNTAFASWVVTRDELKHHGISSDDLASVRFRDSSSDNVVLAVKNGEADVGAVRTTVLEQMAKEGKIALTDFRILNQRHIEGFPFLLSSELYPDFAFARLKHTDRRLADKVAAQLLLMPHGDSTNRYPNPIGWTVPDNYGKVRKLLQEWRLSPFQDYGKVTFSEALRQHWVTFTLVFMFFIALSLIMFLCLNIKRRKAMHGHLAGAFNRLSQVTSDMAHEIRTPLNNCMGEAEIALLQERTPAEYRKVLVSGIEECERLSRLINSLLFLARAENPSDSINRAPFDPLDVIEDILSFYVPQIEDKKAEITRHGDGLLNGDSLLFRQAVSNLLMNALNYSPDGVKIAISIRETGDRHLEVIMSDTGYGMEEKNLAHIFDRFYRIDRANSNHPEGSGLGLSIVRAIMDLHGGSVSITSILGEGTAVTLRFPSSLRTVRNAAGCFTPSNRSVIL